MRDKQEKAEAWTDGFVWPSFWVLSKIQCGSLPFPHGVTAEGPLGLPVGRRFYFDFICVLGFFYRSRARAPGWVWSPEITCLLGL